MKKPFIPLLLGVMLLASCSEPDHTEQLEDRIGQLETALEEAREDYETLLGDLTMVEWAAADLRDAVDGFDLYNWRSVVPAVQEQTEEVEWRTNNLSVSVRDFQTRLDAIESATEDLR